jgi:hypothetical protein
MHDPLSEKFPGKMLITGTLNNIARALVSRCITTYISVSLIFYCFPSEQPYSIDCRKMSAWIVIDGGALLEVCGGSGA